MRKYDAAGNHLWTRQFGTPNFDIANAVATDGEANAYVVGYSGLMNSDAFVWKYDSQGNELWNRQFGTASQDIASGVDVDRRQDVYVVGGTLGSLPEQTPAGGQDAFLRKYDRAGTELWTRQFGSSVFDQASDVSAERSAEVVGRTAGQLEGATSAGGDDGFVSSYGQNGGKLWSRQVGTSGRDAANGIADDLKGRLYVTGETSGAFPGQTSAGDSDAFVLRLRQPSAPPASAGQLRTYVTNDCRHLRIKPRSIIFACGDGNFYVDQLQWRNWSARRAAARGVFHFNDCAPNCAKGRFHKRRGSLVISERRWCSGARKFVFRRAKVTYTRSWRGRRQFSIRLNCPLPRPGER